VFSPAPALSSCSAGTPNPPSSDAVAPATATASASAAAGAAPIAAPSVCDAVDLTADAAVAGADLAACVVAFSKAGGTRDVLGIRRHDGDGGFRLR
jgi:hypothetical protein